MRRCRRFVVRDDGPTAVEYALMLGLIMVGSLTIVQSIALYPGGKFETVAKALKGDLRGTSRSGSGGQERAAASAGRAGSESGSGGSDKENAAASANSDSDGGSKSASGNSGDAKGNSGKNGSESGKALGRLK
jgi:pilus assembly protein Flp/PilA